MIVSGMSYIVIDCDVSWKGTGTLLSVGVSTSDCCDVPIIVQHSQRVPDCMHNIGASPPLGRTPEVS